jgi:hypothetical protein
LLCREPIDGSKQFRDLIRLRLDDLWNFVRNPACERRTHIYVFVQQLGHAARPFGGRWIDIALFDLGRVRGAHPHGQRASLRNLSRLAHPLPFC